jgi:hypothetical protein
MKKQDEYLQHAKDCRRLAKQMESGEQREQLLKMAETWEVLATERERTLRNSGQDPQQSPIDEPTTH